VGIGQETGFSFLLDTAHSCALSRLQQVSTVQPVKVPDRLDH
jgi:hypothetical protein